MRGCLLVLALVACGLPPSSAHAQDDSWRVTLEVYLWAAGLGGTARGGDAIEVDFDELVEDLQLGFMGAARARHRDWILLLDGLYVAVGDEGSRPLTSLPGSPSIVAGYDVDAFVANLLAGRRLATIDALELNLLAGVRYLRLDTRFVFGLEGRPLGSDSQAQLWNGVLGLSAGIRLDDRWTLRTYGDVGTGETDLTWQLLGSLAYNTGRFGARAGYRYLSWDFGRGDQGARPFDDLDLRGPFLAIEYSF